MNTAGIQSALDDVFDQAIVHHAYSDYMRDYEVITYSVADPRTGIEPAYDRYRFRDCVEATITTTVSAETWRCSREDELLDPNPGPDVDGFVWGVRWQCLYPGGTFLADSKRARTWTDSVGVDFHEVHLATNTQDIKLIFTDLSVEPIAVGYRPFMVVAERNGKPVPVLDLVVVHSTDLAATRGFYEALGLAFADEQHGNGPRHLAATLGNGAVLEIFPATSPQPTDSNPRTEPRLGFTVDDIDAVLPALRIAGGTITARPTPLHAVLVDPDGRPIHITAHS